VPYSSSDIHCFMCKDKLKVEKDNGTEQGDATKLGASTGGPGQMCDENSYFVDAKKIRVSVRNKETGQVEKKEVNVHVECLK